MRTTFFTPRPRGFFAVPPIDDVKIIEGLIQSYLDGLYKSDAGKIASVFHPTSALTSVTDDGELVITPRDKWLDKVRARPSPGLPRHDQVLSIDLIGPTMAYVKLKCAIPPRFFTDQLSLLKIDGRWQIAQKVFMTEVRDQNHDERTRRLPG